jgi:hypothetical protein
VFAQPLLNQFPLRGQHDALPFHRARTLTVLSHDVRALIEHLDKPTGFCTLELVRRETGVVFLHLLYRITGIHDFVPLWREADAKPPLESTAWGVQPHSAKPPFAQESGKIRDLTYKEKRSHGQGRPATVAQWIHQHAAVKSGRLDANLPA